MQDGSWMGISSRGGERQRLRQPLALHGPGSVGSMARTGTGYLGFQ